MTASQKVLLGKMPQLGAEALKTQLANEGIELATVFNQQTCKSGCGIEVELWVHPDDQSVIADFLNRSWTQTATSMGYDSKLLDVVFDPNASEATCPACGVTFSTTRSECPDCGLGFGVAVAEGGSCGSKKGCK